MELYCLYDIHKTKTEAFMNILATLGSPLFAFYNTCHSFLLSGKETDL
jgi:hypothetical protein